MTPMDFKKFAELSELTLTDFISDMFTGTGYWIDPKTDADWAKAKEATKAKLGPGKACIEDFFAYMLENSMPIVVTDPEGEEHDFTMDSLERGVDAMIAKAPGAFGEYLNHNGDMCTGLAFIDCCIFGEPVYG